ncbi:DUF1566 domain-containing protein [Gammaproteobacteria bacterium AB-CW1]|uniref:DUF1566 domain-containing protein n=1 Tax=Natronospira elongata TaxID=3110268 RepID=A0AAP6JHR4_9GAMM|nr:DUF1566 domain-containing protein [Gammaproteobacteria bacterium AB-CW1]
MGIRFFTVLFAMLLLAGCGNQDPLAAPTDLTVETGDGEIRLDWSLSDEAQRYQVYVLTAKDQALDEAFETFVVEAPPVRLDGLDNQTDYYLAVVAQRWLRADSEAARTGARPEGPFTPIGGLNDTGLQQCYDGDADAMVSCPVADWPGQDADFGRDRLAAEGELEKIDAGHAGFDFTKIAANGATLPADAEEWRCVRDNVTGLMWEVKTADPDDWYADEDDIHALVHRWSWYNPDERVNGGRAGIRHTALGSCPLEYCSTRDFIEAVNEKGLCGYNDWRLPTVREWLSINNYHPSPTIRRRINNFVDTTYFPSQRHRGTYPFFWSGSAFVNPLLDMEPGDDAESLGMGWNHHTGGSLHAPQAADISSHVKLARHVSQDNQHVDETIPAVEARGDQKCVDNIPRSNHPQDLMPRPDGTVVHQAYGLMWMRCSIGQEWDGETCVGEPTTLDIQSALQTAADYSYAGYDDWRVPNIKELDTLIERSCAHPAIDLNLFPNTPRKSHALSSTAVYWGEGSAREELRDPEFFGITQDQGIVRTIPVDLDNLRSSLPQETHVRLVRDLE